jgi:GNAT superfamily N-acetyltransferase
VIDSGELAVHPVTPDRWDDLVELFGPSGAYSGCWCMWNRQTNKEFEECHGDENRRRLQKLVADGQVPGMLAYRDGKPIGWVSVGPRADFGRLQRSPVTKPVDDVPVWAITCFVIARKHRNKGVATALLDAAVAYAAERGAIAVEGYPVDPGRKRMQDSEGWHGLASMFDDAGFDELARPSETRPLMRKVL